MTPQEKMDAVFENYFALSDALRLDVTYILDQQQDENLLWRRQFIRSIAPLIEGYISCFRDMCCANPELDQFVINASDKAVLSNERMASADAYKKTLKLVFKMFGIAPTPNFGGQSWEKAKKFFDKRNDLMHPKNVQDLVIGDEDWEQIYDGATWMLKQLFQLPDLLNNKFN